MAIQEKLRKMKGNKNLNQRLATILMLIRMEQWHLGLGSPAASPKLEALRKREKDIKGILDSALYRALEGIETNE
jgi:hypothetical protein